MKSLFCYLFLFLFALTSLGQEVEVTYHNETAGKLGESLIQAGYSLPSITKLTVTGNLNTVDLDIMNSNMTAVREIDLSGSVIEGNEIPSKAFESSPITSFVFPPTITSIGAYAFRYSRLSGSLILPESLQNIGGGAFWRCTELTGTLTLPENLHSIGGYAFNNCSKLTGNLIIPPSVTSIGYYCFNVCRGVQRLFLPETNISISNNAFEGCSGLIQIKTLNTTPLSLGADAFNFYKENCQLIVPSGTKMDYMLAPQWGAFTTINEFNIDDIFSIKVNYTSGGTVISENETITDGQNIQVAPYENKEFTILSNEGYKITSVKYNDVNVMDDLVDNTYTTPSVSENAFFSVTFSPVTYNVAVNFNPGGTITSGGEAVVNGQTIQVASDGSCSFKITPDVGYKINSVKYNDVEVKDELVDNVYTTTPVTSNAFFNVEFKILSFYSIAINVNAGGNIVVGDENVENDQLVSVEENNSCSFKITPNLGYEISSVKYKNFDVTDQLVDNVYTIPTVTENASINVLFKKTTFDVAVNFSSGGTIISEGEAIVNGQAMQVEPDGTCSFTITPNEGYKITSVIYNDVEVKDQLVDNVYSTPAVSTNSTFSVTFEKEQYNLCIKSAESGTIDLFCTYGDVFSFNFTPSGNWELAAVRFNGADVLNDLQNGIFTTPSITGNSEIEAIFEMTTDLKSESLSNIRIYTSNSDILIEGLTMGESIDVYTANGVKVFSTFAQGNMTKITVLKGAVYIVKTKYKSAKVAL